MDVQEMERRFKAAIADLGLDAQQAAALGQSLIATEKAATEQQIAYKSDDQPEAPHVYTAPDGTPGIIHDGRFVALKAAAIPEEAEPAEVAELAEVETQADEVIADEPEDLDMGAEVDVIGNLTIDEFKALISEVLAPVVKMQDMLKAMGDMHGELKSMFTTKEAQDAAEATALKEAQAAELTTLKDQQQALAEQQATLAAKIAQIEGDQPAVHLPAEVAAALKSAGPQAPERPESAKIESTPERPWAGWGALTFPELYDQTSG